jgi:hypothetical protein
MHIFVALISPLFDASDYIQDVEVPVAKRRNKSDGVLIAPAVIGNPGAGRCKWLLSLERLPHKQKSWAEIRHECGASHGEFDLALPPLRDGLETRPAGARCEWQSARRLEADASEAVS